jgi:hypothetical protein
MGEGGSGGGALVGWLSRGARRRALGLWGDVCLSPHSVMLVQRVWRFRKRKGGHGSELGWDMSLTKLRYARAACWALLGAGEISASA